VSTPPQDGFPESTPSQTALEPTGVPQLDLILGGGLPRGSLAIILGPPGSGKTTLASQIAFAAAYRGQQVLILTALSEPTTKLLEHLQAYRFFNPDMVGSKVQIFSLQQFLPQGRAATSQEIVAAVRQTKANLVVLDGFQGIRVLEPNITATRQLLYDLGTRLSLYGTTTLITTEADPWDQSFFPEMTTGDILIGLYFPLVGVRTFRNLEVIKVRGRAPLEGRHSLILDEDGMHVFPRLETQVKRYAATASKATANGSTPDQERATFGFPELDMLLGGGLTRNTSTLLAGSLGTGKTLLALHFALAGVNNGEPAIFIGFRETREQLIRKADDFTMGKSIRAALSSNSGLILQHWDPIELNPDQVANHLLTAMEQTGARRLVIDSIAELERALTESGGYERTANYLPALLAILRARGVTLLAIKETSKALTTHLDFSADTLSLLAENVLLTQQMVSHGQRHRVLSVLKMRFSAHDHSLREFTIAPPDGLRVLTPDESGLEILSLLAEQQEGLHTGHLDLSRRPLL
jgi:circadian clock protein KaiC